VDHLLFVLGLLLITQSWRAGALTLTGFTLGHSVTLALGAFDLVRVAPARVETLIAATIVCIGLEALRAQGAPRAAIHWAMLCGLGALFAAAVAWGTPVWLAAACAALLIGAGIGDAAAGWRKTFAFAAGFGLIHGLAFAETLREALTPGGGMVSALVGFNLGVEAGQLLVAGVAAAGFALWRERHGASAAIGAYSAACLLLFGGGIWLAARLPFS
jgi:hypothetical protein